MTQQEVFSADLARINAKFQAFGAVRTEADGFQWVDESRVPASLLSAYQGLTEYGYANGLI